MQPGSKCELPVVGRRRVLQGAALVGAAALTPSIACQSQNGPKVTSMGDELTADEIRSLLKLEANATCGFVRLTFLSKQSIAAGGLPAPFADGRPLGSALYFMVTPGAPVRLHRIRNDQLYHYYLGDPLETGPAQRPARAAADPRQYVPHCTADRASSLVLGREHRVAGRDPGRCRDRQRRRTGREISGRCRRSARSRRVGAARDAKRGRSPVAKLASLRVARVLHRSSVPAQKSSPRLRCQRCGWFQYAEFVGMTTMSRMQIACGSW